MTTKSKNPSSNIMCQKELAGGVSASSQCEVWREVIALRERIKVLEHEAHRDGLTGLFNRRHFNEAIAREIERTRRSGLPTSLIFLDIDFFKHVNDKYGHAIGDQALQHIANAMKNSIRRLDVACRFGGDEYAIVLPGTSLTTATTVAKRLRQNIVDSPLVQTNGKPIALSASFGVAATTNQFNSSTTSASLTLQSLSTSADQALYQAKKNGRNCVVTDSGAHQSAAFS